MCDKALAKEIYLHALSSVMPENLIPQAISYHDHILSIESCSYDLKDIKNLYVYGSGKASIEMAKAMQKVLGDTIKKSLVVSNYHEDIAGVEVLESTHPLPSQKSVDAGDRLIAAFEGMGEDDFFIYLLSGGSSALIEKPISGISLEDFSKTTEVLLHHGLSIDEINTIRKSLSQIKGGGLASKTKAQGIVLVVSDVIGDDLQAIASAPLLANKRTFDDVREIVTKYDILHLLPDSVKDIVKNADSYERRTVPEFPHFLIASNHIALQAAQSLAKEMKLSVQVVTNRLLGDVKEVAYFITTAAEEYSQKVLLFGGEPTVEVVGNGNGGRNQELCLWVLKQRKEMTFLSAGTDGIDGNSDAAGAVVCEGDYHDSIDSYLANSDSYHFLKQQNALIMTGESGTNVMDIMIVIKG